MAESITANDVITFIHTAGEADLRRIEAAVTRRRQAQIRAFRPGQQIRLSAETRPAYLQGQTAMITRVNKTRVVLRLDNPEIGRRFAHGEFTCPVELIEPVT